MWMRLSRKISKRRNLVQALKSTNISELGIIGCPTKGNRKGMYERNIQIKSLLSEKLRENVL